MPLVDLDGSGWRKIHDLYSFIGLGKFHHDLTVLPSPGIMVRIRGIIPFYGRTIQVSELL